jgi:hypothetical protein
VLESASEVQHRISSAGVSPAPHAEENPVAPQIRLQGPQVRRSRARLIAVFCTGVCGGALGVASFETARAFDFNAIGNAVKSLASVKSNLDGDVRLLNADAKILIGDKDKLLLIKDKLVNLAKDTKSEIDSISLLVGEVEGHLKKAQGDIGTTSEHVGAIDNVRKTLTGK